MGAEIAISINYRVNIIFSLIRLLQIDTKRRESTFDLE
jgi:hypothetical protein